MTTVKLNEYPDSVYLRQICSCTSSECDVDIVIDVDGFGHVDLIFSAEMVAEEPYWDATWYQKVWWRIKCASKILFIGRLRGDHNIILKDGKIEEYIKALQDGLNTVNDFYAKKSANLDKLNKAKSNN